jgi:hypothetical protein
MVILATDWQLAIATCYLSDHCGMSDAAQLSMVKSHADIDPHPACRR